MASQSLHFLVTSHFDECEVWLATCVTAGKDASLNQVFILAHVLFLSYVIWFAPTLEAYDLQTNKSSEKPDKGNKGVVAVQ